MKASTAAAMGSAKPRNRVVRDVEIARAAASVFAGRHALCCQLVLVRSELEPGTHLQSVTPRELVASGGPLEILGCSRSPIAENLAKNPRPSGVSRSSDGRSSTRMVTRPSTHLSICSPSRIDLAARSPSTRQSPGSSSSKAFAT